MRGRKFWSHAQLSVRFSSPLLQSLETPLHYTCNCSIPALTYNNIRFIDSMNSRKTNHKHLSTKTNQLCCSTQDCTGLLVYSTVCSFSVCVKGPLKRAFKPENWTENSRHWTGILLLTSILSATGGLAREATTFYKRLASMLSSKWDQPYSVTLCWLCCGLTFSFLRSSIQAIRGSRSSCGHPFRYGAIDLVISETHLYL